MPGGLGPRFIAEATFLILLAVGTALADLAPRTIILVVGAGRAPVALREWTTWRARVRYGAPHVWRTERQLVRGGRGDDPYAQPSPEELTQIVAPQEEPEPRRRRFRLRRQRAEEAAP